MTFNVIDNFLDKREFEFIREKILSENFPWYMNDVVNDNEVEVSERVNNCHFSHILYDRGRSTSEYSPLIDCFFERLNVFAIARAKVNMSLKTETPHKPLFHFDCVDAMNAIFYVNTNNGKTVFKNGQEIEPVENRVVIFDSNLKHGATTTTNSKFRCVINFNYFDINNHYKIS